MSEELHEKTEEVTGEYAQLAARYKAGEELTDEELDTIADLAVSVLRDLLFYFDAQDSPIDEYDGDISKPTLKMLEKAGYMVENWNALGAKPRISWHLSHYDCSDNDSEMEKLAKELDLKIEKMQ